MKKNLKRFFAIMIGILAFNIPYLENFKGGDVYNVFAQDSEGDFTLTGVGEDGIKLGFTTNSTAQITIEEEGIEITGCYIYNGNNVVETSNNNGVCEIKSKDYGITYVAVSVYNNVDYTSYTRYVKVDVEAEEYLDMVLNLLPDSIVGSRYSQGFYDNLRSYIGSAKVGYGLNNCTNTSDGEVCDIEISIGYSDVLNNNEYISLCKSKKILLAKGLIPSFSTNSKMNVGSTNTLNMYNIDSSIDTKDLIFVSTDNTVLSVTPTGEVTANAEGQAEIRLYNKNTFEYNSNTINVIQPQFNSIEEINSYLSGKSFIVDANTIDYYMGIYGVDYRQVAISYINKLKEKLTSNVDFGINYENTSCNENRCRVGYNTYGSYSSSGIFDEFTIDIKGISCQSESNIMTYSIDLKAYAKLYGLNDLSVQADPEYFSYDEVSGTYQPIKTGTTTVTYIAEGYIATTKFTIISSQDEYQTAQDNLSNVSSIKLPYNSMLFTNNLNVLNSVVSNEIKRLMGIENEYINVNTKCLITNACSVEARIGNYVVASRTFRIEYDDLLAANNKLIEDIIEIDSKIKERYVLSTEDTILLEQMYSNTEDFYAHLIDKTDIKTLANSSLLSFTYEKLANTPFNDDIRGHATYRLKFSYEGKVIYTKDVNVYSNHIIDMAPVDNATDDVKLGYVKNYIEKVLGKTINVTLKRDNCYTVVVDGRSWEVILDYKGLVEITGISVNENYISVNVVYKHKIKYGFYPTFANSGKVTFISTDESVATVDADGVITAHKVGIATIKIKVKTSAQTILVTVGKTIEEYLDEQIDKLDTNVIVQYNDITNMSFENALSSAVSQNQYKLNIPIYFQTRVEEENGIYYASLGMYNNGMPIYSKRKQVYYSIKGIRINTTYVDMSENETYDTELYFSEGSLNNLIIDVGDPSVASVSKNGVITALKPGYTYINIYDKYNKYYAWMNVAVDGLTYFNEKIDEAKKSPIVIEGKYYNEFNNYSSHKYNEVEKVQNIFRSRILERVSTGFSVYNESAKCDLTKMECSYELELRDNHGQEITSRKDTFKIEYKGIFIENSEVKIGAGGTLTPEYRVYPNNKSVTIKSLNENVCKYENGVIKATGSGICPVKYSSGNDLSYQFVIVDESGFVSDLRNKLNGLSDTITIKGSVYDPSSIDDDFDDYEDKYKKEMTYNALYETQITGQVSDKLGISYVESYVDLDSLANNPYETEVYLTGNYYFNDNDENIWYNYEVNNLPSRKFKLVYEDIPEEKLETGEKVIQKLNTKYDLTLLQMMRYKMSKEGIESFYKYSSIEDDIKMVCKNCSYKTLGIGGMGDEDFALMEYIVVIYDENNPIASKAITFVAHFDVDIEELTDQDTLIELIKAEVKKAYIQFKGSLPFTTRTLARSRVFNLTPYSAPEDDIEVEVTKVDSDSGNLYNIKVEEIEFTAAVGTNVTGEIHYEASVEEVEFTSETNYLKKGETTKLKYIVTPEDAVEDDVKWFTSDPSIVSIDAEGNLTALENGEVTITVNVNGISATTKVVVAEFVKGDLDRSGSVSISDVVEALFRIVDKKETTEADIEIGDMDGDGKITISDAVAIIWLFIGD